MTPVEEDGGIAGRHLVRQAKRAALHELQGERGKPITLLELLAHVSSYRLNMATFLLANGPLAVCVRRAVYATNILVDIPLAALVRYEDLKAYYCEARAAQPGHSTVDRTTLADWFWRDTTTGWVLFAVNEVCQQSTTPGMQVVARGACMTG